MQISAVRAIDNASLDIGAIVGPNWLLQGVQVNVGDFTQGKAHFRLTAEKLVLPKPFNLLSLAEIRCDDVIWSANEVHCNRGKASVRSAYWQSLETPFSLHITPKKSTLTLEQARIADSRFSLVVVADGKNWQCKIEANQIGNSLLEKLFYLTVPKMKLAQLKNDKLALNARFSGRSANVEAFNFTASVMGLTDQTKDGKLAAEKANMQLNISGKQSGDGWRWQSEVRMKSGALYVDPVYLEVAAQPIVVKAQGWLDARKMKAEIRSFTFDHPDVVRLSGRGEAYFSNKLVIDKADISVQSDTLQAALNTYITPFIPESPFEGVSVSGNLTGKFSLIQQALKDATLNFNGLNFDDKAGRLEIKEGAGRLNWSADFLPEQQSELSWQALALKGLPFEAAKVRLISQANTFRLAEKIKLPVLNGSIAVDKFGWQGKQGGEPDVSFAGSVDNLSLEQLSKRLGWTPLSGNISGQIPGVEYHNKTLSLGGELLIKVFDGAIKISHLTSSGLFSGFPRLESEVEIDNLDLEQLTSKFEFGAITGRLSGFVKNLVLENWHPVSFYAWLGTSEDDDSSHLISQKAVKNIASIGGGGASDVLSRSFLSLFETFRYDKIGMGCYLHDGVCQMMGLEAEGQGYYLIKGGLLPRIDVVGQNNHTNFEQLWQSVKTAIASQKNDIVVK